MSSRIFVGHHARASVTIELSQAERASPVSDAHRMAVRRTEPNLVQETLLNSPLSAREID